MSISEEKLVQEWKDTYPRKNLVGVPNKVFLFLHNRSPYHHCCHLFFGKEKEDYISVIPLLTEKEEQIIPLDRGLSSEDFIFADDLE